MTAKQRAARAKFKAVVKEATKLRKKNPKLTQAQAVKQAWAISYSTKKISGSNYSGLTVEIRPASASSKKFIVWDTKTNQIFANEKFDNYSEAVDFVKQNKLVLRDKKIGYSKEREKLHKNATAWLKKRKKLDEDKSKKDRVSLAYQQAPFGKPGVGAIKNKAATKVKAKKSKRTSEMHTDTKSHNVNIRVVSGIKIKSVGAAPSYSDPDTVRGLQLFADNDSELYFRLRKNILFNLAKKYKKGIFDIDKAAELWRYYIEAAMRKYNKEYGGRAKWFGMLSVSDRNLLAREYAIRTKQEFDLGNFEE